MKKFGLAVLLLAMAACAPQQSQAQAAVYGDFSVAKMKNLVSDNYLYGITTGFLVDGPRVMHNRLTLGGDLQGRFVHKPNFNYDGLTIGPRASIAMKHGIRPYAEFMVGFARLYSQADTLPATTDGTIEVNGGVMKRVSSHIDIDAQYSYAQFYAQGGEYNPKTFSLGIAYWFTKR